MRMRILMFAAATAAILSACGGGSGPSPVEACNQLDASLCERIYACLTAQELATDGYPTEESACVTAQQTSDGCSAKTTANICTGSNQTYHANAVDGCVSQVGGLTCADLRDPNFNVLVSAPDCAAVCAVPN
jgi:hypothetical protein